LAIQRGALGGGMGYQDKLCAATATRWIVINTHPHQEHFALQNLRRQAFESYCPMIRKRRSHARRIDTVLRPLFPSYLFVQLNPSMSRWRPIVSTCGVRSIVSAGTQPSYIEDGFIGNLKAREIDGAIARPANPYRIGQRVQVTSGPFDQLIATIIDMDEKDRLVVLLDIMRRGVKVRLQSASVLPA
jgi:transcriptional antiterminator RfaH